MKPGEKAKIVSLSGGHNFIKKINSMGIRPGKEISKISSGLWRGPQTVLVDKTKIAIGFGMAEKIIVLKK